jgi:hypothetical protein
MNDFDFEVELVNPYGHVLGQAINATFNLLEVGVGSLLCLGEKLCP